MIDAASWFTAAQGGMMSLFLNRRQAKWGFANTHHRNVPKAAKEELVYKGWRSQRTQPGLHPLLLSFLLFAGTTSTPK